MRWTIRYDGGVTGFDFPPDFANPFGGNPFKDRADVENALKALVIPLERCRSPGGARVRLGPAAAWFDQAAADLEGFARPLWGLAAAQAGGATWIDWKPIRRGLAAGTDPDHPEYWGDVRKHDQRLVELAVIGLSLRLVPDQIWHPLSAGEKERALAYFLAARQCEYHDGNWKFFRLMLDMGIKEIGGPDDPAGGESHIASLETNYLGEGWYRDGPGGYVDHYAAFIFHFLGLILARLTPETETTRRYRARARQSIKDISRWFADDGAVLVYGRSMTYRFAAAAYFGGFAFADEEAMPWGQLKGFYLRHLRWWSRLPISAPGGLLDIGYGYGNPLIAEEYNSPQSPYWALQAFLPLALPATHPFWQSAEMPSPQRKKPKALKQAGMIIANPKGDAIALVSGRFVPDYRFGAEKYAKFAFSARYGFSIEGNLRRFDRATLDNMIGFSEDGRYFRVRHASDAAQLADETLYCRWRPYPDITVETWIYWHGSFHIRVHRIKSPGPIMTIEGGFAIKADGVSAKDKLVGPTVAAVLSAEDGSAVVDLGSSVMRRLRVHATSVNTNLLVPKAIVPQLFGQLPAGETILFTAVIAEGNPEAVRKALETPPARPDIRQLEELVARRGAAV
ncbi:DUF2264 domain-containing protein [Taklimakanibacter lacteus]|uniref:DUF2264 domain-containing protein n=1 Tax=Taklimakanibacter lacteus TaxID=2268456 RepID=UPI000E673634